MVDREETVEVLEGAPAGAMRPADPEPLRDLRGLIDELELLGREQRATIEQQESRATRIVAALRGTEAELRERSGALAEAERRHSAVAEEQDRRASQLAEREKALGEREAALDAAERTAAEHERQVAATGQELDARSRALADREQAVRTRETELAAREAADEAQVTRLAELSKHQAARDAQLKAREASVAEREAAVQQKEKGVVARELLVQRLTPTGPTEPQAAGRVYNIDTLERLVESRSADFPHRVAEWETYLFELRSKAGTDGSLPGSLNGLVEDVFAPLV